jgi:hypothetical protein
MRALASRALVLFALLFSCGLAPAATPSELHQQLRGFVLSHESVPVNNLVFKRDRIEFTLASGEVYFAEPIDGRVTAAVFLGQGRMRVEPWSDYEQANVRRMLKSDVVDVTFTRATLRFTDDTFERLSSGARTAGAQWQRAAEAAAGLDDRFARSTGMSVPSRLALSLINQEKPGVFVAEFDGGNKGRFGVIVDPQSRVPAEAFGLNGGEKGVVFQARQGGGIDIWTAFYSEEDFQRRSVFYSDTYYLVTVPDYRMQVDLRDPGKVLRLSVEMDLLASVDGVQWIPMNLNEGLDDYDDVRRKKGVRVLKAELADGTPIPYAQHEWESGFSILLPRKLARGDKVTVRFQLEGNDTLWDYEGTLFYPRSTSTWYPRHGYLSRSRFDVTFLHKENHRVVSVGERMAEGAAGDEKYWSTRWVETEPVALITFAVGRFERHTEKMKVGDREMTLEFYSAPGSLLEVKEDFILAEMMNSVNFMSTLFGEYPYKRLGGVFFPAGYGQGFPTLLLLPSRGQASLRSFAFVSHEAAHQWWGNLVGWRSYRDQWLSEGFAEYCGAMYGARREGGRFQELLRQMRRDLVDAIWTDTGVESGKLDDVGPLVLGHRLSSRRSQGAYQALIYSKGALVLRMVHFLLTDPTTGNDEAFYTMMKDFVQQHRFGWATTESFFAIASRHFAQSPLGKRYKINDLDWFVGQWVMNTGLPKYRLEYSFQPRQGGGVEMVGKIYQEDVPSGWFMPLPLVFDMGDKKYATGVVHALGPVTDVRIGLPAAPKNVQLDPFHWVLATKTEAKRSK